MQKPRGYYSGQHGIIMVVYRNNIPLYIVSNNSTAMNTSNPYIISGGSEGKSRLQVLANVMSPYTRPLLLANGLKASAAFLDVGCGGGNVAQMAFDIVGNSGKVVAIDFDEELIDLNKKEAAKHNHAIDYRAMSAYDLNFENEFDVVYSRFLLSHLTNPLQVLHNMMKSAKLNGSIVVEDINFSGHFYYPPSPAFTRYVELFTKAGELRGQNPNIGPQLISLFAEAGIRAVGFDVIQPIFNKGDGKWMGYITMQTIRNAVTAHGLATDKEIDEILRELDAFTRDETTLMSLPRIVRVWGKK